MEVEYLTRREHEEFARRMETENQRRDDENKRQNKRLDAMESAVQKINELTIAIEKMAINITTMTEALKQQGSRLETIESKPGKRWETLVADVIKLVVAATIGYFLALLHITS